MGRKLQTKRREKLRCLGQCNSDGMDWGDTGGDRDRCMGWRMGEAKEVNVDDFDVTVMSN